MTNDLINSIETMSFKNLTIETIITKVLDWAFSSGVKLIVRILAIVIGFKIINKLSKRFIEFAEKRGNKGYGKYTYEVKNMPEERCCSYYSNITCFVIITVCPP